MAKDSARGDRETFASRFGLLMTMIGVAVGLGNVWRFPYMVGRFGGASFVLLYLVMVCGVGIPALMAEWTLGRHTRKGTLGAFERAGLPGGKFVGFLLVFVVFCATGYYCNTIGWVAFHALQQATSLLGLTVNAAAILPPDDGMSRTSLVLQIVTTSLVIGACGIVLVRGLRRGIERASKLVMPTLLLILCALIARSVTLNGASAGLRWYLGDFSLAALNGGVMAAALGQAVFSLSLGGTFMVVYGSYLGGGENIPRIFSNITARIINKPTKAPCQLGSTASIRAYLSSLEKRDPKKEFLKDVTAFANANGGNILIGIKVSKKEL